MTLPEITESLRVERHRKRLMQKEVAYAVDTTQAAISMWELRLCDPTAANLVAWASALGFDIKLEPRK